ncbi:hypothetical protein AKJ62_02050 [candidate division MSBL1 archaeon SCGC-AAA259D14]|uniref:5-formyltetrahydrofolate cyclo-ligase n=1 Tax=candidate division MSBL1 archaeon SCGC-AAA259D14 TaxID=1698261 RepID=A0A133U6W2_9EURY|nr:hypothetical protein AKJ62_02050 [candidate division MSBL1 archaeon SCGC-AAA259D14]
MTSLCSVGEAPQKFNRFWDATKNLKEFQKATHVKVNPDSPQHPVRKKVVNDGKTLYMPTPRLREGFLRITPEDVPCGKESKATTIKHSKKFGEKIDLKDIEEISLVVAGSVAVTKNGKRVGKGGGYSDIEYGILRELELGKPPIITTIHPIQIVKNIPTEAHDISLDWIITPDEIIETNSPFKKPNGINWSILNDEYLKKIPMLKKLK